MNKFNCNACNDSYENENGESCQECCPHCEFDHYICLDCGYEKCPGEDIDRAMDIIDTDR
jgi:hypothetical protein